MQLHYMNGLPFLPVRCYDTWVYAMAIPSVCASVCLCVTCVLCIKTAKRCVKFLLPPYSPIILAFHDRGLLLNSDGFTPNRGAKYKGGLRKLGNF